MATEDETAGGKGEKKKPRRQRTTVPFRILLVRMTSAFRKICYVDNYFWLLNFERCCLQATRIRLQKSLNSVYLLQNEDISEETADHILAALMDVAWKAEREEPGYEDLKGLLVVDREEEDATDDEVHTTCEWKRIATDTAAWRNLSCRKHFSFRLPSTAFDRLKQSTRKPDFYFRRRK